MNIDGYVGKIWPNGEFGLSREKKYALHRTVHRTSSEERRWNAVMLKQHGLEKCLEFKNKMEASDDIPLFVGGVEVPWEVTDNPPPTIGLSMVAKSHRAKRGQKGISRYGGKLVRNATYLLQRETTMNRISFLTLTLPNVSREESERICRNWSEIVRVLVQRLRRNLRRGGLPGEIVGCTEIQEGRVALTGVFGLHLHMLFVGRKPKHSWALSSREIRDIWKEILTPYLSSAADRYDWRAVENIEPLKAAKMEYLGKYMSKGLKSCQKINALFPGLTLPCAWYMCTNSLRDRVKKNTIRVSGDLGRVVADVLQEMGKEWVRYVAPVKIKVSGGEIPIGYVGRTTEKGRREIAFFINSSRVYDEGASLIFVNSEMKGV